MDWGTALSIAAPTVAIAGLALQVRRWHILDKQQREKDRIEDRKQRDADIEKRVEWQTQISRDIEGNSTYILKVARSLEQHEAKCTERWKQNWERHREMSEKVARLEGKAE